jgi:hypothetical protein
MGFQPVKDGFNTRLAKWSTMGAYLIGLAIYNGIITSLASQHMMDLMQGWPVSLQ